MILGTTKPVVIFYCCFSNKTKYLFFVCDPSVDENHTIIQSAVAQAKMKFNIGGSSHQTMIKKGPEEFAENSVNDR